MRSIIDVMDEQGMGVAPENRAYISLVDDEPPINTGQAFPMSYFYALQRLWDDEGVQGCWMRAYEYALPENMP
jgi:guanine nucleotide-binding protein subunit alpha